MTKDKISSATNVTFKPIVHHFDNLPLHSCKQTPPRDDDSTVVTSNTTDTSRTHTTAESINDDNPEAISVHTSPLEKTRGTEYPPQQPYVNECAAPPVTPIVTTFQTSRHSPSQTARQQANQQALMSAHPTSIVDSLVPYHPPQSNHTGTSTCNYYQALHEPEIAIDSGASDNFGRRSTPGTDRYYSDVGATMVSATGHTKKSVAMDKFDLPLPPDSLDYHVYEDTDIQRPLLSVGKVCDTGCEVLFQREHCLISKGGHVILEGRRDKHTGLYLLPNSTTTHRKSNNNNEMSKLALNTFQDQNIPQLMQFLHACAGFPPKATWIKAINRGYYATWPGLTASRVRKYLPQSEETALGHLKQTRQGLRSTSKGGDNQRELRARQTVHTMGKKRHITCFYVPIDKMQGIVGTDQTGRFPTTSGRGHKYLFIMYDVDVEYIHAVAIKSRKKSELIRAFKEAYDNLTECGFEPILHRIDHETSEELISAIKARGLDYQIIATGAHRQNPAERAIQTFKSHFISIINGVDKDYPRDAWDYLIPQANVTLNLLRQCGVNQAHSAYSYIHGTFDYNAHPLSPLGCKAIVHEKSIRNGGKRPSWGNKGKRGFYIGPALKSYRCWRFYMPATRATWDTDTAVFHPKYRIPIVSVASTINEALDSIKATLEEPKAPTSWLTDSPSATAAINRLRTMYGMKEEAVSAPRVEKTLGHETQDDTEPLRMNEYSPRKKQKYPLGTRIKIQEKQHTYVGTATKYDPLTGMYYIEFEDGEYEEFDEEEMRNFRYRTPFEPRKPSTYACQLIIPSFFPKATDQVKYCMQAGSIWDEEMHMWMSYRDLLNHPNPKIRARWVQAGVNEFARLAQGYGTTDGLDVVFFINRSELPTNKQATYARYVVDYRPEKDEPWRLRITCGGDRLDYDGNTTTHSASMETIKLQLNDIISTKGGKAATGDISNMYLASDLPEAEYVRFRLDLIPEAIQIHYGLRAKAHNGYVYARVNKAWYGLKQAGKIAHDDLVQHLAAAGYHKTGLVEGYFKHEDRNISFTLVVDDFLIKYVNDTDLNHLITTMRAGYAFKVDADAKQYVGIALKWDYDRRTVRLSMPGYVRQALLELEHELSTRKYHSPSRYMPPSYGAKVQYAAVDTSAPLTPKKINFIQRAVGKLLYYARAVDPTMLHALNDISLSAAKGTQATLDATIIKS